MAQRDREGGAGEAAAGRSGSAGCGMVPPGRLQGRGTIPLPPRSCLNTSSCQFNCCPACSAKCRGPQPPPAAAGRQRWPHRRVIPHKGDAVPRVDGAGAEPALLQAHCKRRGARVAARSGGVQPAYAALLLHAHGRLLHTGRRRRAAMRASPLPTHCCQSPRALQGASLEPSWSPAALQFRCSQARSAPLKRRRPPAVLERHWSCKPTQNYKVVRGERGREPQEQPGCACRRCRPQHATPRRTALQRHRPRRVGSYVKACLLPGQPVLLDSCALASPELRPPCVSARCPLRRSRQLSRH